MLKGGCFFFPSMDPSKKERAQILVLPSLSVCRLNNFLTSNDKNTIRTAAHTFDKAWFIKHR